jgi:hypothetical protein
MEIITPKNLTQELLRLSRLLDEAHDELIKQSHEWAVRENEYRLAKASAHLASSGTVDERRAYCDKATSQERLAAHLAEGLKVAALEAVRSRRAQLSALQSVGNAVRSEIEMAGRYSA